MSDTEDSSAQERKPTSPFEENDGEQDQQRSTPERTTREDEEENMSDDDAQQEYNPSQQTDDEGQQQNNIDDDHGQQQDDDGEDGGPEQNDYSDPYKQERIPVGVRSLSVDSGGSDDDGPPESPPPLNDLYPDIKLLVDPLEPKYGCLNCKQILRQPVKIKACGHHLCYPCYEDVWSGETPQCPEDKMEMGERFPVVDKEFRDEVEQLKVRCQNHEQDCKWEGTIKDFTNHVELCGYFKMPCEYDCGTIILKCLKEQHVFKDCPRYSIKCPYCDDVILRENKKAHYHNCEKLPLPCPNKCEKKRVSKDKMDIHIENECSRSNIVCKFGNVGCSYQTGRDKMDVHSSSSKIHHLQMLLDLDLKHAGLLKEIMKQIEEHEVSIKERDIPRICELEKMTRTQLIWRIDNFKEKMDQAKTGNNESLFHPPFTTSKHGYRLSASVCLNGDGKGKGTHMSVFISVLKGPFDSLLQWPFECRVSFTLLDQNPDPGQRKHIKFSIKPNPCPENEPFLGRPKMEKNSSFGCAEFAKHEELKSRNYTDNDKLFLKIAIDWKCDVVPEP